MYCMQTYTHTYIHTYMHMHVYAICMCVHIYDVYVIYVVIIYVIYNYLIDTIFILRRFRVLDQKLFILLKEYSSSGYVNGKYQLHKYLEKKCTVIKQIILSLLIVCVGFCFRAW